MANYKQEMMNLVLELQAMASAVDFANDPQASEKAEHRRRQAEVLEFIINHPEFITTAQDGQDGKVE